MTGSGESQTAPELPSKQTPSESRTPTGRVRIEPLHEVAEGPEVLPPATETEVSSADAKVAAEVTDEEPEATPAPEPDPAAEATPEPSTTTDTAKEESPETEAEPAEKSSAPESDSAATESGATQPEPDAAAAAEAAAEKARQLELQKLIDSRQFYVPIDAVGKRKAEHRSLWMILVIIVLSVILLDLMLDANIIVLIEKLPHTHFFEVH